MDKVTERIGQLKLSQEEIMVASLDVVSLYPSLDIPFVAKLVAHYIIKSGLNFQGIDWKWAAIYLALSLPEEEINSRGLKKIIPKRRCKKGRRPNILSIDTDTNKDRWVFIKHLSHKKKKI